jgi:hypothetical protein
VKTLLLGLCLTAGAFGLGQTRYIETVNSGASGVKPSYLGPPESYRGSM